MVESLSLPRYKITEFRNKPLGSLCMGQIWKLSVFVVGKKIATYSLNCYNLSSIRSANWNIILNLLRLR